MRAQRVSRERAVLETTCPGAGFFSELSDHGTETRFQVYFPACPCQPSTNSFANALSAGREYACATGWRAILTPKRGAWRRASAARPAENGFQPGSRIALADNHPRWITAYLGIIAAGCTAVPLDTAFHADQVAKLLQDSGSSLLFCDGGIWQSHNRLWPDCQCKSYRPILPSFALPNSPGRLSPRKSLLPRPVADLDRIFAEGSGNFSVVSVASDSVASLLYTSGTTADPKGVMLTHANLMGEVKAVFGWAQIGPEDAVLGVLPLFHVLSQMANLLLPLVKGCRVVYLEPLTQRNCCVRWPN